MSRNAIISPRTPPDSETAHYASSTAPSSHSTQYIGHPGDYDHHSAYYFASHPSTQPYHLYPHQNYHQYQQYPYPQPPAYPSHPQPSSQDIQPPPAPVPLTEVSSSVLNTSARKARAQASMAVRKDTSRKSRAVATALKNSENVPPTPSPSSSCGIGPSTSPSRGSDSMDTEDTVPGVSEADMSQRIVDMHMDLLASHGRQATKGTSAEGASDVWFFMVPVKSQREPARWSRKDIADAPVIFNRPNADEFPALACRLCAKNGHWKAYKHKKDAGITSPLRVHLKNVHRDDYTQAIDQFKLKNAGKAQNVSQGENEPFSLEKVKDLLVQWIVSDDQSANLLDNPEFRRFVLYVGQGNITDEDLPKRTALSDLITQKYNEEIERIEKDLANALGRVSFSTDLWLDNNLRSFMAITAHYIVREKSPETGQDQLVYRSGLIAFRYISGSHTGENLAHYFFSVLSALGITHKIGVITMDNASNNNMLMRELKELLEKVGVTDFCADGNRIRCFPHVVNLACQEIISEFEKKNIPFENYEAPEHIKASPYWPKFVKILQTALIPRVHEIISSCRRSGGRRSALLREGNKKGWWGNDPKTGSPVQLPVVQLLRDCETRWSSTFLLLSRFLTLYTAIVRLCNEYSLDDLKFTDEEHHALFQVHCILAHAHHAQELLSFERTPTLAMAIPTYEILLHSWRQLKGEIPEMTHFIDLGIKKIEAYLAKTLNSRTYSIVMVLNPALKMAWTGDNWVQTAFYAQSGNDLDAFPTPPQRGPDLRAFGNQDSPRFAEAKKWVLESMKSYQTAHRKASPPAPTPPPTSNLYPRPLQRSASGSASSSMFSGVSLLLSGGPSGRGTSLFSNASVSARGSTASEADQTTAPSTPNTLAVAPVRAPTEAELLAQDQYIVEREFNRYIEAGLATLRTGFDQVNYWERHEAAFPNLFHVAMDVLPMQASAVVCERVFSSSKETCTLKRSRLSEKAIEALQILKYSVRQRRISFMDHYVAKAEDYEIEGPVTAYAMGELLEAGREDIQLDLLENHEVRRPSEYVDIIES